MRESKGIILAVISAIILAALGESFIGGKLPDLVATILRWVTALTMFVGILDAMQIINVLNRNSNSSNKR